MTVDPAALDDVGGQVARHIEAPFVAAISGMANLFISVACLDIVHLYRYLVDTIEPIAGIRHLHASPRPHP